MATISVEQMRERVQEEYQGKAWRDKVTKMPDNQVIRLYYSFNERGKAVGGKPKRPRKPHRERPRDRCEQLSFEDM